MTTLFLITVVTTIISAITQSGHQGAVVVLALELSFTTHTRRTRWGLVRGISTVLGSVTIPIVRNTFLIITSTGMLASF